MNNEKGSILVSVLLFLFVVINLLVVGTYSYKNQQITQNMLLESYTLKIMLNLSKSEIKKLPHSTDWKRNTYIFEEGTVVVVNDVDKDSIGYTVTLENGTKVDFQEKKR